MRSGFRAAVVVAGLAGLAACGGARSSPSSGPTAAAELRMSCPREVVGDSFRQHAACLDPYLIGDDAATSCGAYLEAQGWGRDVGAEIAAYQRFGRNVTCYRSRL